MILPAPYRDAIAGVQYDYSNKIAFEARRFWEAEQIYGGITFVGGETALIWYPSDGLHSARGMLLGCYSSGQLARSFQKRSIAEQIAAARAAIEMAHPGHSADCVSPVVVNWHKVPYSLGPWPAWNGVPLGPQDGPIDQPRFSPAPQAGRTRGFLPVQHLARRRVGRRARCSRLTKLWQRSPTRLRRAGLVDQPHKKSVS